MGQYPFRGMALMRRAVRGGFMMSPNLMLKLHSNAMKTSSWPIRPIFRVPRSKYLGQQPPSFRIQLVLFWPFDNIVGCLVGCHLSGNNALPGNKPETTNRKALMQRLHHHYQVPNFPSY